jgi:hypothetical protein
MGYRLATTDKRQQILRAVGIFFSVQSVYYQGLELYALKSTKI